MFNQSLIWSLLFVLMAAGWIPVKTRWMRPYFFWNPILILHRLLAENFYVTRLVQKMIFLEKRWNGWLKKSRWGYCCFQTEIFISFATRSDISFIFNSVSIQQNKDVILLFNGLHFLFNLSEYQKKQIQLTNLCFECEDCYFC